MNRLLSKLGAIALMGFTQHPFHNPKGNYRRRRSMLYHPNGKKEVVRRRRQIAKGMLKVTPDANPAKS